MFLPDVWITFLQQLPALRFLDQYLLVSREPPPVKYTVAAMVVIMSDTAKCTFRLCKGLSIVFLARTADWDCSNTSPHMLVCKLSACNECVVSIFL